MVESQLKLSFRCNDEEMALIEKAASEAGCSKSQFVRDTILKVINRVSDDEPAEGLILTASTQLKIARCIAQLSVLAEKKLMDDGETDFIDKSRARARNIITSTQDDDDGDDKPHG